MSPSSPFPGLRRSVAAACLALASISQGYGQPASSVKVARLGPTEDKTLVSAIQDAGGEIVPPDSLLTEGTGILFYSPGLPIDPSRVETIRAGMERLLKNGGTLIFDLSRANPLLDKYEKFLPVNVWSMQDDRLGRLSTGAVATPGSAFEDCLRTPGFELPTRYDLHLPYSTLEGGQQRYEAERMGKDLLNTDWRVLLTTDRDGRLPLLVAGRYGAGQVFVFAGSLSARPFQAWQGYQNFIKTLLDAASPQPVGPASDAASLRLELPPAQPVGPLHVRIHNPTGQSIAAVLACKVRNAVGSLMNSYSQPVTVAAGVTLEIPLVESSPELQAKVMGRDGDMALSYRRVEAGLSAPDRNEISTSINAIVDRTPAVTLDITGEDMHNPENTDGWANGGGLSMGVDDCFPIQRFVYFCGQKPKATIHLANALHNIAPLARAIDAGWPENPSTQGLNDLCYSYADLRGHIPLTGYWSGKKGLPTQQLRLDWPVVVTMAGQQLSAQGEFRHHDRDNPADYTLTATQAGGKIMLLADVHRAVYTLAQKADQFAPTLATSCALTISGFDPKAPNEPNAFASFPGNAGVAADCSLDEWIIQGWPGANLPPAVKGTLRVSLYDLSDASTTVISEKEVTLNPCSGQDFEVELPTRAGFGEVRLTAEFSPAGGSPARSDFSVLFVPPGRDHLLSRDSLGTPLGLLCSPGFTGLDPFGKGTDADTQGWGGPDDKVWAWSHGLMEIGHVNVEQADRFYLSPVGMTHYTGPWRDFPSGRYVWDWATDCLLNDFKTGKYKGKDSLHILFSDRWNGIPIGSSFGWADLIAFDQWLRDQGKLGLQSRTRVQLSREVVEHHCDEFQRFQLTTYTDALKRSQDRLAEAGVRFTAETHGSFPLVGGELGEESGKTDKAVGTDLFWEFRDEDLYKSLGYRFGLVAANPDFESGAYSQWGWVSSVMQNATWYAPSGESEASRRQWYATYFQGRVTSDGAFKPYTMYGFTSQGGVSVKGLLDDWQRYNRVQTTTVWVRPERPTGCGIVASWPLQESRMTSGPSQLGFGLYAGGGFPQVDALVGELYQRLERNGVPISFVASTDTLKKWQGTQALIVAEGFEITPAEIANLERLNRLGAPVIAVGSHKPTGRAEAEAFFGVAYNGKEWTPAASTTVVNDAHGAPLAYITHRQAAPTLFCPTEVRFLDGSQSELLAGLLLDLMGKPLAVAPGFATTTFSSNGSLFLVLGSQSDAAQVIPVAVEPALLDPTLRAAEFRVVDIDDARVLPSQMQDGVLHFEVPCGPNDGRMIQILPLTSRAPVGKTAMQVPAVQVGRR